MANKSRRDETQATPASASYWDNRYLQNETGWDMHQVSPPLKEYIDGLKNKDLKILIPGCGKAYEADYLLEKQFHNTTLIDFFQSSHWPDKEKIRRKANRNYK
jgi:hypothetical protein